MSVQAQIRRNTAPDIAARKGGEAIVSLTAYHAHTAAMADPHVDFLLVGDSLGMVMHGFREYASGTAGPHDHARSGRDAGDKTCACRCRYAVRDL